MFHFIPKKKKEKRQLASNTKTSSCQSSQFFKLYTAVKSVFRMNNIMLAHAQLPEQYAAKKKSLTSIWKPVISLLDKDDKRKSCIPTNSSIGFLPPVLSQHHQIPQNYYIQATKTRYQQSLAKESQNISIKRC